MRSQSPRAGHATCFGQPYSSYDLTHCRLSRFRNPDRTRWRWPRPWRSRSHCDRPSRGFHRRAAQFILAGNLQLMSWWCSRLLFSGT